MRANEPIARQSAPNAASAINILLGIWVLISPWILGFHYPSQLWNNVATGGLTVILSALHAANPVRNAAISWISFLLGIWLIISGFILGPPAQPTFFWNQVVLGILVAIVSIWSTAGSREIAPPAP